MTLTSTWQLLSRGSCHNGDELVGGGLGTNPQTRIVRLCSATGTRGHLSCRLQQLRDQGALPPAVISRLIEVNFDAPYAPCAPRGVLPQHQDHGIRREVGGRELRRIIKALEVQVLFQRLQLRLAFYWRELLSVTPCRPPAASAASPAAPGHVWRSTPIDLPTATGTYCLHILWGSLG